MSARPIRIDRDAAYTRTALKEQIADPLGIHVDTFLARLKPRKVFRMAWLGEHILEAWRTAPPLDDEPKTPKAKNRGNRGGRTDRTNGFAKEDLGICTEQGQRT